MKTKPPIKRSYCPSPEQIRIEREAQESALQQVRRRACKKLIGLKEFNSNAERT